jgi:hypothetical protein
MAKNKKPKKKHRPLGYRLDPFAMLRDHSRARMTTDQVRDLMILVHSSLKSIEEGKGIEEDIINLAVAYNITIIFAEHGLGEEFIPEIKPAGQRIVKLQKQWNDRGTAILSGPGMMEIRRMLELHDAQSAHEDFTEARVTKALNLIHARMQAGHFEVPEAA